MSHSEGQLGTNQSVAYTGTAGTIATAFGAQTRRVRVVTTTAAFISIGSSPTATTSDYYMPANIPEFFTVSPSLKISALQVSAGGTLYVTELA